MATWLAAVSIACLLRDCLSITLVVNARYQLVPLEGAYRLMCQADVPLAGCQVQDFHTNTIYDLSQGRQTPEYWGDGLEDGQCGFTMNVTEDWDYSYGCRARAFDGGWQYATTNIERASRGARVLNVNPGPRLVIADPGSNVTLLFQADDPLYSCSFQFPGESTTLSESNSEYSLVREGDQCHISLFNVATNRSGVIKSHLRSAAYASSVYRPLTTLIVKMAPGAPALSLSKTDGVYNDDDVMEASCHVGLARPVARITWLMNDDVIQGEPEDFSKMPWEFEAGNATRKLKRRLSIEDDGKELVCRVHQIALPRGVIETRSKIIVRRLTEATSLDTTDADRTTEEVEQTKLEADHTTQDGDQTSSNVDQIMPKVAQTTSEVAQTTPGGLSKTRVHGTTPLGLRTISPGESTTSSGSSPGMWFLAGAGSCLLVVVVVAAARFGYARLVALRQGGMDQCVQLSTIGDDVVGVPYEPVQISENAADMRA